MAADLSPLVGYRLSGKWYRRIAADASGRFKSCVLNLDLHVRDGKLRFRDPATGEDLTTYREAEDGRLAQEHRADTEQRRADGERRRAEAAAAGSERTRRRRAAERELARLREQLKEP